VQYQDGQGVSTFFDISLTNTSAYYPWESDKNGKNGVTQSLLGVSMVANTAASYELTFLVPGTDTPYIVDSSKCHHAPHNWAAPRPRRPAPP
jgi:hypothetical protein